MEYDFTEGKRRRCKWIALKSTQVFLFAAVILLSLAITVLCIGFLVRYEVETDVWNVDMVAFWQDSLTDEQKIWFDDGIDELREALKVNWEFERASSVVIFVVHGVSAAAQAAVRFDKKLPATKKLIWENFPHMGHILQPCNASSQCDAHSVATGFFSGVRTTNGIGGLDSTVMQQNCVDAMDESRQIKSLLQLAQERNLRTGFVTTRRVSGPTMAALYAHTPDTSWECEENMPPAKLLQGCKDIATQLIDDETGERINVIMGGGRQTLLSNAPSSSWDPLDSMVCKSKDNRNFLRDWRNTKISKRQSYALVRNSAALGRLNGSEVDFVLGIFANGNIKPPWLQNFAENTMPELSVMVRKALDVLKRPEKGFVLIVECGNGGEDIAHQIKELERLNNTINELSKVLSSDTLTIVVLNSKNPDNKMAGQTTKPAEDDLLDDQILDSQGDFNIFSKGPGSYLLQGINQETYLAHAVSFALKMGQFQEPSTKKTKESL